MRVRSPGGTTQKRAPAAKAPAPADSEDSETIAALRAELGKGESELSMREERELLLQQEVHDLSSTRSDLENEVQTNQKRQAAELQMQVRNTVPLSTLEAKSAQLNAHARKAAGERAQRRARCTGLQGKRRASPPPGRPASGAGPRAASAAPVPRAWGRPPLHSAREARGRSGSGAGSNAAWRPPAA